MSAAPVSHQQHPPHGHPENRSPSTQASDKPSTASHPPRTKPDPTIGEPHAKINPSGKASHLATDRHASGTSSDLTAIRSRLSAAMTQYPDWPKPGILFEDIMPLFASPNLHADLIHAMELTIKTSYGSAPDVIVALESRGFFFGPSLALRLGCGFVPVRKQGKLPGDLLSATYEKEYGQDQFEMQKGVIRSGQTVLVVDDLIATGGSAAAAGKLIRRSGGELMGYLFLVELDFLKGREKLDRPVCTVLGSQSEEKKELPLGRTHEGAGEVKSVQDAGGAGAETRP